MLVYIVLHSSETLTRYFQKKKNRFLAGDLKIYRFLLSFFGGTNSKWFLRQSQWRNWKKIQDRITMDYPNYFMGVGVRC